jgi:hypothetical protein
MAIERITDTAADRVAADLVEFGGGTYEAGTLTPFVPTSGFAVGVGGFNLPADGVTVEQIRFGSKVAGEYGELFVGTWLDDGTVYFDAVRYFGADRREAAIALGIAREQAAIYDFGAKASIILTDEGGIAL